ncbi:discoidin domain-containing protein [Pedobacter glucosidilyticus]|uniref:discoidin domain-containing protein n=1 Tax=Pedobacter glucosidilyticus TaxID=1122941 RepID=UPI0026EE4012|nr:discoidin domain-containing protein [Pedobacter glucosidilyticus]
MKVKLTLLSTFFYFFTHAQTLHPNISTVANGGSISFRSSEVTGAGARPATNVIDGNEASNAPTWTATTTDGIYPQSVEIDLGVDKNVQASRLFSFANRGYYYKIEAKEDGGTYSTIVDKSANTVAPVLEYWSSIKKARYVKLTILGHNNVTVTSVSVVEFAVYGKSIGNAGTLSGSQNITLPGTTTFNSTISGGTWSSSNTSVATVNSSTGEITGVAEGTATITYTVTGNTTTSGATATRDVIVSGTLPITITSFTATQTSNYIDLKWQSKGESKTSHFSIYRSTDGRNFKSLVVLNAAGNSTKQLNYNTKDSFYPKGYPVIYYKLETTDLDGKVSYSNIIAINVSIGNNLSKVFPNPTKDKITLTFNAENPESIRFQIIDLNGKVINYQDKPVVYGINQIEFNVSQLTDGTYLVKWGSNLEKFIKTN